MAGFSKSYSSLLAFLALPTRLKDALKVLAPPYLYSGPSPVASLATTLAGLAGEPRRAATRSAPTSGAKTHRLLDGLHAAWASTRPNTSGLPIIEVPLADHEDIDEVGRYLFDHGVYATLAAYPLVPKDEVGFRIQTTAANTDEEVEELVAVLGEPPRALPARAVGADDRLARRGRRSSRSEDPFPLLSESGGAFSPSPRGPIAHS